MEIIKNKIKLSTGEMADAATLKELYLFFYEIFHHPFEKWRHTTNSFTKYIFAVLNRRWTVSHMALKEDVARCYTTRSRWSMAITSSGDIRPGNFSIKILKFLLLLAKNKHCPDQYHPSLAKKIIKETH